MTERLLLDTCALIWIAADAQIDSKATEVIELARNAGQSLFVSPVSAWEVGILVSNNRLPLTKPPMRWFSDFMSTDGVDLAPMSPGILVSSSFLPPPIHNDPHDRILIATAREHDMTIVTRDSGIRTYAAAGHVRVLVC